MAEKPNAVPAHSAWRWQLWTGCMDSDGRSQSSRREDRDGQEEDTRAAQGSPWARRSRRGLWPWWTAVLLEEWHVPWGTPTLDPVSRSQGHFGKRHGRGGRRRPAGPGRAAALDALQGGVRVAALTLHQGLAQAAGFPVGLAAPVFTDVICGVNVGNKRRVGPREGGKRRAPQRGAWVCTGPGLVVPGLSTRDLP